MIYCQSFSLVEFCTYRSEDFTFPVSDVIADCLCLYDLFTLGLDQSKNIKVKISANNKK